MWKNPQIFYLDGFCKSHELVQRGVVQHHSPSFTVRSQNKRLKSVLTKNLFVINLKSVSEWVNYPFDTMIYRSRFASEVDTREPRGRSRELLVVASSVLLPLFLLSRSSLSRWLADMPVPVLPPISLLKGKKGSFSSKYWVSCYNIFCEFLLLVGRWGLLVFMLRSFWHGHFFTSTTCWLR